MDESNLVIGNTNPADSGNYTCLVQTELEHKSASARLMVMGMIPLEKNPHFSTYITRLLNVSVSVQRPPRSAHRPGAVRPTRTQRQAQLGPRQQQPQPHHR